MIAPSLARRSRRAARGPCDDYKRNGTTTLFAALDAATGKVMGLCLSRHRHKEFLAFLKLIDGQVPKDLDVHLVLDNFGTHKHPVVMAWLAKHRRFHLHFTPTSSSWLNLVERWFRDLTDKAIRHGVFPSVEHLIDTIDDYLDTHNADPSPSSGRPRRVDHRQGGARAGGAQASFRSIVGHCTRASCPGVEVAGPR